MKKNDTKDLDSWIAEHVMGYRWFAFRDSGSYRFCSLQIPSAYQARHGGRMVERPLAGFECDIDVPRYSKEPQHALMVLKKCAEKTLPTVYKSRQTDLWCVDNQTAKGETTIITTADTVEEAIALFAMELFKNTPPL